MNTKTLTVVAMIFSSLAFHDLSNAQNTISTKSTSFSIGSDTETPDGVLKPGSYTLRVADHLADRMVIEIQSSQGNLDEKFLGVPAKDFSSTSPIGPYMVKGVKGKAAMRGFSITNGSAIEFVYLKDDAVALAKANDFTVLAIDPSSEGIPSSPHLSPDDLKIVTMWMLTPTPVGPSNAKEGIQAARYEVPENAAPVRAAAGQGAGKAQLNGQSMTPSEHAESRPPVISRLPKTASEYPLLLLLGVVALGSSVLIRLWRVRMGGI